MINVGLSQARPNYERYSSLALIRYYIVQSILTNHL